MTLFSSASYIARIYKPMSRLFEKRLWMGGGVCDPPSVWNPGHIRRNGYGRYITNCTFI